jgi:hypothetical protein
MSAVARIVGLLLMLLIGMAIGINAAEENMQKMQGLEGAPRAIQITPKNGRIEIAVLGQVVRTDNPVSDVDGTQVRQAVTEVRNEGNVLAASLNRIGSEMRGAARGMVELMLEWFMGE